MISLQRSMHSSQMYTPGPAISFFTCFWLFPQKEHFSRSESPNFAIRCWPSSLLPTPNDRVHRPVVVVGLSTPRSGCAAATSGVIPRR